jgi:hypothetical protein
MSGEIQDDLIDLGFDEKLHGGGDVVNAHLATVVGKADCKAFVDRAELRVGRPLIHLPSARRCGLEYPQTSAGLVDPDKDPAS